MILELRTKPTVQDGIVLREKNGSQLVIYEPGNGTRYTMLITQITPFGFTDKARDALGLGKRSIGYVVAWPHLRYQSLTYTAGSYLAPIWLCEKTGCTLADAVVLCELLAYLTDCTAQTCEEYRRDHDG